MKYQFKFIIIVLAVFAISCNRRIPQVIYQEKIVTKVDTVEVVSNHTDTIPCADFDISMLTEQHDTVYVKVVDKQLSVKYIKRTDTVYKQTIIVQPAPLLNFNKTKIDNSVKNKAKKGSAIGDGNKIDNRKIDRFWLGVLVATGIFYIIKIALELIKKYFPPSIPFISLLQKFLP